MAIMPIQIAPHPILKRVADPVDKFDDKLHALMDSMLETMYNAPGIGLAAPQVLVSKRVMVVDVDQPQEDDEAAADAATIKKRRTKPRFFVNPEIIWSSEEPNTYEEGCLSLPGQYAEVERPKKIRVKYFDYHGEPLELEADGLLATCIQHEIDHLNGVLFIDHLSSLKRDMVLRKLKKWIKDNPEDIAEKHVL